MANAKSDCKWAKGEPDAAGLFWCDKLGRMVSGAERPSCEHYEKES
jgi:hypothetical protein